ncbi:hypothetical protein AKJ16_DCAP11162 [Drosera capensis]
MTEDYYMAKEKHKQGELVKTKHECVPCERKDRSSEKHKNDAKRYGLLKIGSWWPSFLLVTNTDSTWQQTPISSWKTLGRQCSLDDDEADSKQTSEATARRELGFQIEVST